MTVEVQLTATESVCRYSLCRKEETFNYNQTFQVLSDVCLTQTFTYIKTSQHFLTPTLMMSGFN